MIFHTLQGYLETCSSGRIRLLLSTQKVTRQRWQKILKDVQFTEDSDSFLSYCTADNLCTRQWGKKCGQEKLFWNLRTAPLLRRTQWSFKMRGNTPAGRPWRARKFGGTDRPVLNTVILLLETRLCKGKLRKSGTLKFYSKAAISNKRVIRNYWEGMKKRPNSNVSGKWKFKGSSNPIRNNYLALRYYKCVLIYS